jgi:hypothetical protein
MRYIIILCCAYAALGLSAVSQSGVYYSLYDMIANKIHMQHYCSMQHYLGGIWINLLVCTKYFQPNKSGNQVISISIIS